MTYIRRAEADSEIVQWRLLSLTRVYSYGIYLEQVHSFTPACAIHRYLCCPFRRRSGRSRYQYFPKYKMISKPNFRTRGSTHNNTVGAADGCTAALRARSDSDNGDGAAVETEKDVGVAQDNADEPKQGGASSGIGLLNSMRSSVTAMKNE